jgi:hypothetical protein
VAIALHWLMAAGLIVLLAMGLYMVSLPDAGLDTRKIVLIPYHKLKRRPEQSSGRHGDCQSSLSGPSSRSSPGATSIRP